MVWSVVTLSKANKAHRLDAEYFDPAHLALESSLKASGAVPLFAIVRDVRCGPFGSTIKKTDYQTFGVPLIRVADTAGPFVGSHNLAFVRRQLFVGLKRYAVMPGDIVASQRGTIAQFSLVTDQYPNWLISANLISILQSKSVDTRYLLAFLNSRYGNMQLLRLRSGQVQPKIITDDIKTLKIVVPSEAEMKFISDLVLKSEKSLADSARLQDQAESLLISKLGLDTLLMSSELFYERSLALIQRTGRLDPEFHQPKYDQVLRHLSERFNTENIELWGKVLRGRSVEYSDSNDGIPVIRSGDLIDLDNDEQFYRAPPTQQMLILRRGDVCISSIGFGSIGKVQVFDKQGKYTTVGEVTVVRQQRVNPYFLQVFLRSIAGQLQIERWITGATGQLHLYPRDVGKIIVPIVATDLQNQMEELTHQSRQSKQKAAGFFEEAKHAIDVALLKETK